MDRVRNIAFLILCAVSVFTWQGRAAAAPYWEDCDVVDTTIGGCEYTCDHYYCQCRFAGYCAEDYCLDALMKACWICSDVPDEYDCSRVRQFECTDYPTPPSDFTFECDWWNTGPYPGHGGSMPSGRR